MGGRGSGWPVRGGEGGCCWGQEVCCHHLVEEAVCYRHHLVEEELVLEGEEGLG
jgi:hypothetical protein